MTRESQAGPGPVIAACSVSQTSLKSQPPTEEGARSYKMETEGDSHQSSCQEALPAAEIVVDDPLAKLSGLTHLGLSCQPVGGHLPNTGNLGYSARTNSKVDFPRKGSQGLLPGEASPTDWRIWAHRPMKSPVGEDKGHLSRAFVHAALLPVA